MKSPLPIKCEAEKSGQTKPTEKPHDNEAEYLTCTACKKSLPATCFGRDKRKKSGLKSECQPCCNAAVSRWRNRNPEKAREACAKSRRAHPEKVKARSRKWYIENKELSRKNAKEWRKNNPDRVREHGREYSRKWRAANPEKAKENARRGSKKRREDPIRRLEDAIKNGIYRGIRGISKAGHTFDMLGYSLDELTAHIQSKFKPGMSWDNYGEWHVDHKVPLAAHNYQTTDDIDFKKAWALSNLQPMWGSDNQSKGAKLMKPFQPSLALQVPANDNVPASLKSEAA